MDNLVLQLVTVLGPTGVLAWYCYYVTSVTLPSLVKEFREEAAAARLEAKEERLYMARMVDEFHAKQDSRMQELTQALARMIEHCTRVGVSALAFSKPLPPPETKDK